ncbi:MAG: tetratricopeptide repeat protein, partial [Planctomycetota bacterium]
VENYLDGTPLIAGPPSTIYRLKKLVCRNRALIPGIAAVLAVLIAGVVGIGIFAIKAEQSRAEAHMISNFLRSDVLFAAGKVKGRDATAIDLIHDAVEKLDEGRFRDQPLVEADIRSTLSSTYYRLGNFKAAAQHQKRAYDIYLEQLGEEHKRTRGAMNLLAVCYFHGGKYQEAEPLYEQIIEEARQEKSRVLTDYLSARKCNLATTYAGQGRYEEAEALFRTTLESDEWDKDFWPESERMAQYGHHLADIYRKQGRYDKAEQMYLRALEKKSIRFPAECDVRTLNGLGRLRLAQGRYDDAQNLFTRGIEIGNSELPGKGHPWTLHNVNGLAVLRTKQGNYDEAAHLFQEVLEGRKEKLGDDHPDTMETKNDLGLLYTEQTRYEEAKPLLLEALEGRRLKLGDTHPHTLESWNNLIDLYEAWNKPDKAEEWRAKLLQTKDSRE